MDGTLRSRRLPMAVLLLLCAAPPGVYAQQFVCWPIARGDTAAGLSHRLTGDAAAAYSDAFQIRDPVRQLFVPKSQYRALSTRWQACVADKPVKPTPVVYSHVAAAAAAAPVVTPQADASGDDVLTKVASAAWVMLLMCAAVGITLVPNSIPPVLHRAGEKFIIAFARPLIDSSSRVPPIEVRLRFRRHARLLEISIAPGVGRRYPNLVDHKRNVEYDVHRVMRVLGNDFVVSDRLRAVGKWVVVSIREADVKQTGAR